jgi:hypothetical protein
VATAPYSDTIASIQYLPISKKLIECTQKKLIVPYLFKKINIYKMIMTCRDWDFSIVEESNTPVHGTFILEIIL